MENKDLSVKILLQKCKTEIMEKLVLEISIKLLHQIMAKQFYNDLGLCHCAKSYRK